MFVNDRRSFLRGLTALPLIGGSVALIGRPTRIARAASDEELVHYLAFVTDEMMAALKYFNSIPPFGKTGYAIEDAVQRYKSTLPTTEDLRMRAPLILAAVTPSLIGRAGR